MLPCLKTAANNVGSVVELAKMIGENPTLLHKWKEIPERAVRPIVAAQKAALAAKRAAVREARVVTAAQLRPDLYRPNGRKCK